jgi:hypothetical protein
MAGRCVSGWFVGPQEMSETSEKQNAVSGTMSWTWQILGVLLGTGTAISIIKNGFGIDVYGLPAKVLAQYVWLRDSLLAPVVWAVRYFGIEIAWWVKDAIMAYALVGAAHARAYQLMLASMVRAEPDESPTDLRRALPSRYRLLVWPQITGELFRNWMLARADRKYFVRFPATIAYVAQHKADGRLADSAQQLGQIALQVAVIAIATMAFFLWNYLSGLYGPN